MRAESRVTIAMESPRQADVVRLIEALDAYQTVLYPAESNHLLELDTLAGPSVRFFVARCGREAIACGALWITDRGYGEVKRMFVVRDARRRKLATRMLERMEEEARREGVVCLRLETGIYQPEALALYRAAGFVERDPFGDYRSDPLSVFMEKTL